MGDVTFRILGPSEAWRAGSPLRLGGRRQRAVLAAFLLHPNQVLTKEWLTDKVWTEPPVTAEGVLYNYISRLRSILDGKARPNDQLIVTREGGYELRVDPSRIDARRFERDLAEARELVRVGRSREAVRWFEAALSEWRGPVLADLAGEAFVAPQAARLEHLRLAAAEELVTTQLLCGLVDDALERLEGLVREEPLNESIRAKHMQALVAAGRQADALASWDQIRRDLREQLGVDPSAELAALQVQILRQEAQSKVARPPAPLTTLPRSPSPFIGRERELHEIVELLRSEDVRVVTLTGPGGSGKTRLALEAATEVPDASVDGTWWIPLASIRDPLLLVPTILQSLGATTVSLDDGDALRLALTNKRALILLDNCEQLLPEVASCVASMRDLGSNKVLVTSREPLRITGEHVYHVPPLGRRDAVALFSARVRSASGVELEPTHDDVADEICRRLDDLPLAIELAAAQVRLMSPTELLERLEDRLPLLVGGARDAPDRHRTIRATIEWSYHLLDEDERDAFARLSVFEGGCTLEAAKHVGGADLATMSSLVDKNLLRMQEGTTTRYMSLETVHEFARERLAERSDADEVHRRHAEHLVAFVRETLPGMKGHDQPYWFARLAAELDNIRAALRWTLDRGEPNVALELVSLVWEYFFLQGDAREGRAWIAESLDRADPSPSEARALALAGSGWLAVLHGDDIAVSEEILEEALRCASGASMITRAYLFAFLGGSLPDGVAGRSLGEEAVALARQSGDRWILATTLHSLAERLRTEGDYDGVVTLYREELLLIREVGDRVTEAMCLSNLGEIIFIEGDREGARELFSQASDLADEVGDRRMMAIASINLGWIRLADRDLHGGEDHFRNGLIIEREFGSMNGARSALTGLAGIAAARGEDARAGLLVGAADSLAARSGPGAILAGAHEPYLSRSRARSGDLWEVYLTEGATMSLDDAVDLALTTGT